LLSKWPIRNKLLIGIALLVVIVATLSWSGFRGVYAYRSLVRSLSNRGDELPLAALLSRQVSDLRVDLGELPVDANDPATIQQRRAVMARFATSLTTMRATLLTYRAHLVNNDFLDSGVIKDSRDEWETVHKINASLDRIADATKAPDWLAGEVPRQLVRGELARLQALSWDLPSFLHQRIHDFAGEVRVQYRALIILTWVTTVLGTALLGVLIRLFYAWVFRPLRLLIKGCRHVAAGEFGYRIKLDTHDEMAELADSMNDMTARFETTRDDLDRQVRERTKEVVRSEQLASVGFLAAGVAHEINNPLASIALCAESLEGRVEEVMATAKCTDPADFDVIRNYLRMIQNEAFRCKGITERLLDFSRMGDVTRHSTDLRELIQGVIDMVGHLGRYQDKRIDFVDGPTVVAPTNSQEIKQVVLNLITNGLDSLSPGGVLTIELRAHGAQAELVFTDNGCGMNDEVLKHLFEPFFTRRRNGQGTGLGLSITYRIVADHGGRIDVHSDGPGHGSRFRVWLPLAETQKESHHRHQAA